MTPSVISVKPLDNYILEIEFDNGRKSTLDMKSYLDFGVFKKLKDKSEFNDVFVSFDTIQWRNGVDLDPQFVYDKSI